MEEPWSRTFFEGIKVPGITVKRVVCNVPGTVHIVLTFSAECNGELLLQKYKDICELHKPVGYEFYVSVEESIDGLL